MGVDISRPLKPLNKTRMAQKIQMINPLVEIDGDEMTRVLWPIIKEKLIIPFVDLKTEYYDLGIENRDKTDDRVTEEAAFAIKKWGVGVKNATITPNEVRVTEYNLKTQWKSPNGTIRAILDGTIFRKPILVNNIKPSINSWKKPIIVGRHAYGDVYKSVELGVIEPGKAELVFTNKAGEKKAITIHEFDGPGVLQAMHNTTESIQSFAHSCFTYALDQKMDLWFATKDTISKIYDQEFKNIFQNTYEKHYRAGFEANKINYHYTLIDDMVAKLVKSEGGFLWACKNYDGDVMSDLVASAFGSLAMMTSVLVSPHGYFEYEAAHGTVQQHYYKHLRGETTSTNPTALIFAWTGALRKRAEIDGIKTLIEFADKLDRILIETVESGVMTGDLALLADPPAKKKLSSIEFIEELGKRLCC